MSNRLDQDRKAKLQPQRIQSAKTTLVNLGYLIIWETDISISFMYNGNKITLFPYSGWFTGIGIKDGRGIQNLLKQLK